MSPTSGMYHSRPTDLVIRCIAVGLENAFELSQKMLWPIASTTQAKVEHHGSSGPTVLPESSGAEEFHLCALPEPDVSLATHPAPIVQPGPPGTNAGAGLFTGIYVAQANPRPAWYAL